EVAAHALDAAGELVDRREDVLRYLGVEVAGLFVAVGVEGVVDAPATDLDAFAGAVAVVGEDVEVVELVAEEVEELDGLADVGTHGVDAGSGHAMSSRRLSSP